MVVGFAGGRLGTGQHRVPRRVGQPPASSWRWRSLRSTGATANGPAIALAVVAVPGIAFGAQRRTLDAAAIRYAAWFRRGCVTSARRPGLVRATLATMFVGASRVVVAELVAGLLGLGPAATQTWSHEIATQLAFAVACAVGGARPPVSVALVTAIALAGLGMRSAHPQAWFTERVEPERPDVDARWIVVVGTRRAALGLRSRGHGAGRRWSRRWSGRERRRRSSRWEARCTGPLRRASTEDSGADHQHRRRCGREPAPVAPQQRRPSRPSLAVLGLVFGSVALKSDAGDRGLLLYARCAHVPGRLLPRWLTPRYVKHLASPNRRRSTVLAPRQAEDALGEDVLVHLGRAARDRERA